MTFCNSDERLIKFPTTILVEVTQQPPEMAMAWWGPLLYTPPILKSSNCPTFFFFTSLSSSFLALTFSDFALTFEWSVPAKESGFVFMQVWVKVKYLGRNETQSWTVGHKFQDAPQEYATYNVNESLWHGISNSFPIVNPSIWYDKTAPTSPQNLSHQNLIVV